MQECKIKRLEEAKILKNKTLNEIKKDFRIQSILITVLAILAIIVCFGNMKQAIDYEALKQEKEALEEYIELENMKFGGNK